MIKTKRDAENFITALSDHNWTYLQILSDLTEVTGDTYHTSSNGINFYINHRPASYDSLVIILFKNRKAYNAKIKERNQLLKNLTRA